MRYFLLVLTLLFIGCSDKNFQITSDMKEGKDITIYKPLPSKVDDFDRKTVTLEDGHFISKDGKLNKSVKGSFVIDKDLVADGNNLIVDGKKIKFSKMVLTATKKDNLIAVLFMDNHFELYSLKANKTLIKTNFDEVYAVDNRVARPLFYDNLIVVPTLNGNLAVYDAKKMKYLTDIPVSTRDFLSNIIFLAVKGDYLIAASKDRIISRGTHFVEKYDGNIQNVLADDKNLYVFDVNGNIIKMDFNLKIVKKLSLPYAHFIAPALYKNKIIFGENSVDRYIFVVSKNLDDIKYHYINATLDADGKFLNSVFYYYDMYVDLKDKL